MADTAVAITAGAGTNIDTRTESTNSNHRQVIVIGDPATNAGVAPVDVVKGLAVDLTASGALPTVTAVTTVSTVTNLSQMSGAAIAMNTGVRSAGTQRVTVATDDVIQTTQAITATANGGTASRINAAASTNATSLKASAGQLYTIDVFNAAAYNVFLKLYNKASAPTVGSDTPVMTIPVQAGGGYSKTWTMGFPFSTGIAYAITKLQADSDTTVVVAGDLTGNTLWI